MRCIVYILKQVRFSYLSLFSLFLIIELNHLFTFAAVTA